MFLSADVCCLNHVKKYDIDSLVIGLHNQPVLNLKDHGSILCRSMQADDFAEAEIYDM